MLQIRGYNKNVANKLYQKLERIKSKKRKRTNLTKELEDEAEAYIKYTKTTNIPVNIQTFFNKYDPETLQEAEGAAPLKVYLDRWRRDKD